MGVVFGVVIGNAGCPAMHIGSAALLGGYDCAGRGLPQWRSAEKYRPLISYNDRLVGHRRHVGAASRAGAHDDSDLGDALRRHLGLIVEDSPEMIPAGEHLVL